MDTEALKTRINAYERLMRLDKPIGTLLLLWPTLWAVWIGGFGRPQFHVIWIFAFGTLLMRSAGCVMNDISDRKYDPHVMRTRDRPLATGEKAISHRLAQLGWAVFQTLHVVRQPRIHAIT